MLMQLRKAANHDLLLPTLAYNEATLKELAGILHSQEPGHADTDPALILEDLAALSDHQVHKVCRLYDVLNSFALPAEALLEGSGTIRWLDEHLPPMLSPDGGDGTSRHRVLIFRQFVLVLDILGEYLVNKGIKCLRMEGSTPVQDRQTLIDTVNR